MYTLSQKSSNNMKTKYRSNKGQGKDQDDDWITIIYKK